MKQSLKWISTLFVVLICQFSLAQEKTVTGVISDETMPLPGATVVVKNTSNGVQADFDGNYSIKTQKGAVLVFSFVGYKSQEVTVGDSNTINIVLAENTQLDEVVVMGFVTQKAENISSAVENVGAKELSKLSAVTSLDNALQGKAAGVQVVNASGRPGQAGNVRIRGVNSLTGAGANPIYVVDGSIMTPREMTSINPDDVASMVVLKDAAAAALYGSRAGNGVIIVTTKRGKVGSTIYNVSTSMGSSERVNDNFDVMNAQQFIDYEIKLRNAGVNGIPNRSPEEQARLIRDGADWQNEIFRNGLIQSTQFSASHGTENSNFRASFSNDKNTGLVRPFKGYERLVGRVKAESKMKHNVTIGSNISMAYSEEDSPRESFNVLSPVFTAYGSVPIIPKYQVDQNGQQVLDTNGNPIYNTAGLPNNFNYFDIYDTYFLNRRDFRAFGNVFAKIDDFLIKGLSFKSDFSATYARLVTETFVVPGSNIDQAFNGASADGSKTDTGLDDLDYRWVNQVNYNTTINEKHNIAAVFFSDYNKFNRYNYTIGSRGFPNSFLQVQSLGATPVTTTTGRSDNLVFGYGANVNYDYNDKYFLSGSIRRDGNSSFGENTRFGYFPGASAGWKISSEDFMDKVTFINLLRLRASYGETGNIAGIGQTYATTNVAFPQYNNLNGAAPSTSVNNPNLGWESVKTTNIGVEFQMMDRKLSGKVDYFIANRTGFYFSQDLPTEGGGYATTINAGEFENRGFEFTLSYDILRSKNLNWSVYGNLTLLQNEIMDLNGNPELFAGSTVQRVGGNVGEYFLVRYAGINPANGEPLYYDIDGNVTNVFNSDDADALSGKTPNPTYFGGFGTSFRYKGFDLSADFVFQGGNYIQNIAEIVLVDPSNYGNQNFRTDAGNFWTTPGQTNVLPNPINADGTTRQSQLTDQFLQKGDFVRFRTLNIGYTFGKDLFGNIPVESLRVFFQGQNLATFTNFRGDPEVGFIGLEGQGLSGESYRWAYPNAKIISFGAQLSF